MAEEIPVDSNGASSNDNTATQNTTETTELPIITREPNDTTVENGTEQTQQEQTEIQGDIEGETETGTVMEGETKTERETHQETEGKTEGEKEGETEEGTEGEIGEIEEKTEEGEKEGETEEGTEGEIEGETEGKTEEGEKETAEAVEESQQKEEQTLTAPEVDTNEKEEIQKIETASPKVTSQTDIKDEMTEHSAVNDSDSHRHITKEQSEEQYQTEEEEEEEFDRDEAIEHYKGLFSKIEKLQATHHQLQHKIAEYLARKVESKREGEQEPSDQEQRYQKSLKSLDELQLELTQCQLVFENEEHKMKAFCQQKEVQVSETKKEFVSLIQEQAALSTNSRTGRKMNIGTITERIAMLENKDKQVTQVRLENIKLQNKIHKLDTLIKQKEQLAEGLHMIDFEQLRINNADLNDKIEDRNEEILKLKKKITSTIQVLAHLKEKLQFLQAENISKNQTLKDVEKHVAKNRDLLTRLKQAKDSIRTENSSLSQQGGLVGHHKLLRDFENKQDQSEEMKLQLQKLQNRHSNLILQCNTLRQRIDQTRLLQT